jgi:hypothetical protein
MQYAYKHEPMCLINASLGKLKKKLTVFILRAGVVLYITTARLKLIYTKVIVTVGSHSARKCLSLLCHSLHMGPSDLHNTLY